MSSELREAVTQQQLIEDDLKKMEEPPMWPLNQWLLPSLLKRGIQASASEENQSMARPLSSALLPALKEKASSQGCGASGRRIWAILHDSGLTCGTTRRPLVKIRFQTSIEPRDARVDKWREDCSRQRVHCRHLTASL